MSTTLYELSAEYAAFLAAVEDGEIPEEAIADTLEGLSGEFAQKADNIACIIKELEARAAAIKEEAARLSERQAAATRQAQSLKRYLSDAMQRIDLKRLETPRNALSFRRSTSVYIPDEEGFKQRHMELCRQEVRVTIPKKEIGDRLKAGEQIEGAELRENRNLQIK